MHEICSCIQDKICRSVPFQNAVVGLHSVMVREHSYISTLHDQNLSIEMCVSVITFCVAHQYFALN